MMGGLSIVFTRKAVVDETLIRIQQLFANQSLELMRSSFTPNQCVNICQQDCSHNENYIPIFADTSG